MQTQAAEHRKSLSAHSLDVDELCDELESVSIHSIENDLMIQRELSPLSRESRVGLHMYDAPPYSYDVHVTPLQSIPPPNTLKLLSPRSWLDRVTTFPEAKKGNDVVMNNENSPSIRSAHYPVPKVSGLVSGNVKARKSVIEGGNIATVSALSPQKPKAIEPMISPKDFPGDILPQPKPMEDIAVEESWHVADTSAPWSRHALREVEATHHAHSPRRHDTPNLFKLRQELRKVESSEPPKAVKPPTPPLSQWRRSPGRPVGAPQDQVDKDINCGNCNPSEAASSAHEESDTGLLQMQDDASLHSHALLTQKNAAQVLSGARGEWEDVLQTPSRLRLRDLEHTLARQSADEVQSWQDNEIINETQEMEVTTPPDLHSSEDGETHIHNPRPFLPPDHACEWRARCMDLNSEVDQLKSELGEIEVSQQTIEQRSEPLMRGYISVGVGDAMAQHECHEFGIEGLTIVLHMRGKDDLVINTDLAKETPPAWS